MAKKKRAAGGQPEFTVNLAKLGAGTGRLNLRGNSERDERARERVRKGMDELLERGLLRVVVDGSELTWLTVDVVGAITGDFLRLVEAGGGIAFAALQPDVEDLLTDLGVLEYATPYDTGEEAAAALAEGGPELQPLRPERLILATNEAPDGKTKGLSLIGSLDAEGAPRLQALVEELIEAGARQIVIDGQRLLDADDAGIGALVMLSEAAQRRKARIHFSTLWGVPGAIVEVLGLSAVLPTYPSAGEAMRAFAGEKR